jgi:hypothetical protein
MIHVQSSPPPAKRRLQLIGCMRSSLAKCSRAIASTSTQSQLRLLSLIKQCTDLIYCARTTAPIRTAAQATKAVDYILTLLPADDGPPRQELTIPAKRSRPRDADPVRHRLPIGGGSHGPKHLLPYERVCCTFNSCRPRSSTRSRQLRAKTGSGHCGEVSVGLVSDLRF